MLTDVKFLGENTLVQHNMCTVFIALCSVFDIDCNSDKLMLSAIISTMQSY